MLLDNGGRVLMLSLQAPPPYPPYHHHYYHYHYYYHPSLPPPLRHHVHAALQLPLLGNCLHIPASVRCNWPVAQWRQQRWRAGCQIQPAAPTTACSCFSAKKKSSHTYTHTGTHVSHSSLSTPNSPPPHFSPSFPIAAVARQHI